MIRRLTAAPLVLILVAAPSMAQLASASSVMSWTHVDYFAGVNDNARKIDARLVLDSANRQLAVTDEDSPSLVLAAVPYDAITSITYSNSKHTRWRLATGILECIHFSMQNRAAFLNPAVMSRTYDSALVNDHRAYRNTTFAQAFLSLFERCFEKFVHITIPSVFQVDINLK